MKLSTFKKLSKKKKVIELDKIHLEWFKSKYGHENNCIVCGFWRPIMRGHFIKRRWKYLRWDVYNVNPICMGCNNEDDLIKYGQNLTMIYGWEIVDALHNLKSIEPTHDFYNEEFERITNEL